MRWVAISALLVTACGDPEGDSTVVIHLGEAVDDEGEARVDVTVEVVGIAEVIVELDGEQRIVEAAIDGAGTTVESTWYRPRPIRDDRTSFDLTGDGIVAVTVWARGAPTPAAVRERTVVWIDPAIVDDPEVVGLGRVMAAAAADWHGGRMLHAWFERFSTTVHSERVGRARVRTRRRGTSTRFRSWLRQFTIGSIWRHATAGAVSSAYRSRRRTRYTLRCT
jgi:hypothetical protein